MNTEVNLFQEEEEVNGIKIEHGKEKIMKMKKKKKKKMKKKKNTKEKKKMKM